MQGCGNCVANGFSETISPTKSCINQLLVTIHTNPLSLPRHIMNRLLVDHLSIGRVRKKRFWHGAFCRSDRREFPACAYPYQNVVNALQKGTSHFNPEPPCDTRLEWSANCPVASASSRAPVRDMTLMTSVIDQYCNIEQVKGMYIYLCMFVILETKTN